MGPRSRGRNHVCSVQPLGPLMEGPDPEAHGEGAKKERYWEVIRTWLRLHMDKAMSGAHSSTPFHARSASKRTDLRLILGVLGCPLAPIPVTIDAPTHNFCIEDGPMVMFCSPSLYFNLRSVITRVC